MEYRQIGYYSDRRTGRVSIDRQDIEAAFGRRIDQARVEVLEGAIVLTNPAEKPFTARDR